MEDTLARIRDLVCSDDTCTADAKLQHTRHVFEGVMDHILNGLEGDDNPYPPRSSRAASWGHGIIMGRELLQAYNVRRAAGLAERGAPLNRVYTCDLCGATCIIAGDTKETIERRGGRPRWVRRCPVCTSIGTLRPRK